MKSIEDAFLADVLADPFDDTPRLIFADWCEENGQHLRAHFIRSGIAGQRPTIAARENKGIWDVHGDMRLDDYRRLFDWWRALPVILGATLTERRGWIGSVSATVGALAAMAVVGAMRFRHIDREFDLLKDLFRCQPITDVRLTDVEAALARRVVAGVNQERFYFPRNAVPTRIYGRLTGREVKDASSVSVQYLTQADAIADLRRAAVDLGRHLAGLPKLDWSKRKEKVGV